MLTKKQKEVLDFIKLYREKNGYAPSLEEIKKHMKISSVSTAHYYVNKLEKGGYLKKESNQPRGMIINNGEFLSLSGNMNFDSFSVPILGSANCGPAEIFADENIEGYLKVSKKDVGKKDGIFVLRAEGDSMNKAKVKGRYNIENGDYVVIDYKDRNVRDGDYVLSIIDGMANLKKFEHDRKNGDIKLVPESTNPKHKYIYLSSHDNFMINGKILAVVKK